MSAYLIWLATEISDPDKMGEYSAGVMPTLQTAGARVLAAEDAPEVIEGQWDAARTVVIEFPSIEAAKTWYDSDEYRKILPLRHDASEGHLIFLNGFVPPA